jgi:hypothetical protein
VTQIGRPKKIVVLGMMARSPVAGMVWLTMQYVVGLNRLGYDTYYVEAHARTPSTFTESATEDGSVNAAAFIDGTMRWFGLPDGHWAFQALHSDRQCYGLSELQLNELYRTADLIINLHGGTMLLPEHIANGRLLFLETDPVEFAIYLAQNLQEMVDYMAPHSTFFTWGENYGKPDCRTPVSDRFDFKPTRQPVVVDLWHPFSNGARKPFTTVASWRQQGHDVKYQGEVYQWSKHHQFLKVIELPGMTAQPFELALAAYDEDDRRLLEERGWTVRDATSFAMDVDAYRGYIGSSRGEFTIAKDQYVRPRSGWFSDRSATYLAAGRPVITQETGFSNHLPTGEGLFAFSSMEEIVDAVDRINSDYERHAAAALEIARSYFSYDVVLPRMLQEAGL